VTVTRLLSEDEKAAVLACQTEKAERDGYDVQAALQEAINRGGLLTDVLKEDGYTCTVEEAFEMARLAEAAAREAAEQHRAGMEAAVNEGWLCPNETQPPCEPGAGTKKSMAEKNAAKRDPAVKSAVARDPTVCNPQSNLTPQERAKYC
jgi:hypothetical protein